MSSLLLERHDWETSGSQTQVQVPKAAFAEFFGRTGTIHIIVRTFDPPTSTTFAASNATVSYYDLSDTYRFNLIEDFGALGHAVIVLETTNVPGTFNLWWFTGTEADTVLSRPFPWQQAKSNQYGPGRFWAVLDSPAPRVP